jgi:glycosyltransferase involved in cell wall biosynthesis
MRILMLSQSFAPIVGGEERVVEDLSTELIARGHDVVLATLTQPGIARNGSRASPRIYELRSSVYRVPGVFSDRERRHAVPGPDPETVLDLRRVLRAERPDVVHAHNWIAHSYLPLRRRGGPAFVMHLHDYALVCATKRLYYRDARPCSGPGPAKCVGCAGGQFGGLRGAALALGMTVTAPRLRRGVDMFVAVSAAVRDGCGLAESDRVRVVPNLVRELPPPPAPEDPRLAGLPNEPFVLFFGDATHDKGAQHLADVYATLDAPPPLVFLGRCMIEGLADPPGVTVLGPWPHALAIEAVRRSLFTVAPSLWSEPFGVVALEAAAAGRAVVASDTGGLPDIVVDGETGILVAPGDQHALRAALQRLLSDSDLRRQMGARGALRARVFRADVVVPAIEDAYRAALRTRNAAEGR